MTTSIKIKQSHRPSKKKMPVLIGGLARKPLRLYKKS